MTLSGRVQKATAPAMIFSWGARALYVGPALGLSAHRSAVGVLAVGVEHTFGVAVDPMAVSAGSRMCRTALIRPNTLHRLTGTHGRMAFLYVDARGRDLECLVASARAVTDRAAFDLRIEPNMIATLGALADGHLEWATVRDRLERLLALNGSRTMDPRVLRTVQRLHRDPAARLGLAELAAHVGLSGSRLRHLFIQEVGLPLRRYRIWIAMGAATRAIARGATLTTAAHDAGFSSSAHFSTSYREMFGLEPSRLAQGRLAVITNPAGQSAQV
jgi:AraC-like DNA-binding protein